MVLSMPTSSGEWKNSNNILILYSISMKGRLQLFQQLNTDIMALIELKDVTKKYDKSTTALRHIDLSVNSGEFVYLVGPSGAGKSSLIRLFYQEEKLTSGSMKVGEFDLTRLRKKDVPLLRRSIGVVFQDYKLLPKKTAFENVAYAMEVIGEKPRHIKKRVTEVLELVGLKHKMRSFPNQLSGGEQQRVAIARAIVNNPKVLIADEPTGNLDPEISWEIMQVLERINLQGTTIIMATHNSTIVNNLRHRVVAIEEGRIVRDEEEGEYGYHDQTLFPPFRRID